MSLCSLFLRGANATIAKLDSIRNDPNVRTNFNLVWGPWAPGWIVFSDDFPFLTDDGTLKFIRIFISLQPQPPDPRIFLTFPQKLFSFFTLKQIGSSQFPQTHQYTRFPSRIVRFPQDFVLSSSGKNYAWLSVVGEIGVVTVVLCVRVCVLCDFN